VKRGRCRPKGGGRGDGGRDRSLRYPPSRSIMRVQTNPPPTERSHQPPRRHSAARLPQAHASPLCRAPEAKRRVAYPALADCPYRGWHRRFRSRGGPWGSRSPVYTDLSHTAAEMRGDPVRVHSVESIAALPGAKVSAEGLLQWQQFASAPSRYLHRRRPYRRAARGTSPVVTTGLSGEVQA
jgi:hypothetical protein